VIEAVAADVIPVLVLLSPLIVVTVCALVPHRSQSKYDPTMSQSARATGMTNAAPRERPPETSVIDTLQSLIVAFVLAMTFRGFVLEGFIIPTGSMAPTLMGQHILWDSNQTGATFPIDARPVIELAQRGDNSSFEISDPMLGPDYVVDEQTVSQLVPKIRTGDRILVLKCLYPFSMPDRFDVVVFKNPTDPVGDTQNYIKRLIGLPDEKIWLVDGDVFAGPGSAPHLEGFQVQRKPDHVQRAVWQPVSNSDFIPEHPERLRTPRPSPWFGENWEQQGRAFRCDTAAATTLSWNPHVRQIDDWTAYDMLLYQLRRRSSDDPVPVSDVRVAAGIVPDEDGFETTFELAAREHIFEFSISAGQATVRMRHEADVKGWAGVSQPIDMPGAGDVVNVEFWHVDQRMAIYINGEVVVERTYDWSPEERLEYATSTTYEGAIDAIERLNVPTNRCDLSWHFQGSPVTLHRVRVDRDIHYRIDVLKTSDQRNEPRVHGPAFGTHPDNIATLGSDYYMMLGDNATASLDSRLWGSAHRLVRHQITDAEGLEHQPFRVHRRLLIGKAFAVYFPALYPLVDGGWGVVPDFGRLRFIR
jgi:signal peptidase I